MLKHNVRSIAREASAAPAAKFKSFTRTYVSSQASIHAKATR
jgi:hypothetical protein